MVSENAKKSIYFVFCGCLTAILERKLIFCKKYKSDG